MAETRILQSSTRMEQQLSNVIHDIQYIKTNLYNQSVASYHNKILQKLNPLSVITKKIIRHHQKQQIMKMSLVPIIREFLLTKIHNLAQIQFQYNPFQRTLVTLSNGKKITQVISECIKLDSMIQMYSFLMYQQLQNNPQPFPVSVQYLQPILSHAFEVCKYYTFTIDTKNLEQLLWNFDVYMLAGTEEQFIKQQNEVVSEELKKFGSVRVTNNKKITIDFKRIIGENLLKRKKISVQKKYFFGVPQQFEDQIYNSITNAFQEQILMLQNIEDISLERKSKVALEKQRQILIKANKDLSQVSEKQSQVSEKQEYSRMSERMEGKSEIMQKSNITTAKYSNNMPSKLFKDLKSRIWDSKFSKISQRTQ